MVERRGKARPKFYLILGLLIWLAVFFGFYRSFYLNHWFATPPGMRTLTPFFLLHGTVFSLWIGLAVLQPALIVGKNRKLHKRVGWLAVGLAVAVFTIGNLAAIESLNHGLFGPPAARRTFYAVPVFDMLVFAACVAFAVHWRNHADTHKRLMFLSFTQLLHAAVGRYPLHVSDAAAPWLFLGGSDIAIIGAGAAYDLATRGRVHRVWLIGGALVLLSEPLRLLLGSTQGWQEFAGRAASLWPY